MHSRVCSRSVPDGWSPVGGQGKPTELSSVRCAGSGQSPVLRLLESICLFLHYPCGKAHVNLVSLVSLIEIEGTFP